MIDILQHRWCVKSTVMDRHWYRLTPLPRCCQGPEQRVSTPFQKLDISLGSMVFCPPQHFPCAGARLEQLQSVLQCRDLFQSLRGVADHARHVSWMEDAETHQGREITRNGSRDRHVSIGQA